MDKEKDQETEKELMPEEIEERAKAITKNSVSDRFNMRVIEDFLEGFSLELDMWMGPENFKLKDYSVYVGNSARGEDLKRIFDFLRRK